ncbi:hypothetical protein ACF0H5_001562 [Mactra antiquata]
MMILYNNIISMKMEIVGAVVFIRLLLLIAGVEPNPGPNDKLVFRYQYLLVEVGTKLLRKLFDDKTSNDLMQYLRTYPHFANQLSFLINKDIITDDQKTFLPPLDNTPNSENFDITLLTCLLKNICGLKSHLDPVWKQPGKGDMSVEAEITRLKECRNFAQHMCTVFTTESEFNRKWDVLCQILHRLNGFCCIPDLTEMIDDARTKILDEQLKRQYDNILKEWRELDFVFEKGIVDLKLGQSELKTGQSVLKDCQTELKIGQFRLEDGQSDLKIGQLVIQDGLSQLKDGQIELRDCLSNLNDLPEIKQSLKQVENCQAKLLQNIQEKQEQTQKGIDNYEQCLSSYEYTKGYDNDAIKECLKTSYVTTFSTVCVTPLYCDDDRLDMLTIYKRPLMRHIPYHRARQNEGNYEISSCKQVFCQRNTFFKNIFLTGDAGVGKTCFGQFMSLLWCKVMAGETIDNEEMQEDARFMAKFDYVFYISLRDTRSCHEDVVSMIIDRYFYTSSKDKFEGTIKSIEHILQTKHCLVILDALDEWTPDICGNRNLSLPRKVASDTCIYLTTCRPYIIENVRLSDMDIDHQVQITGFNSNEYIRGVIDYINKSQQTNKDPEDFLRQIYACNMLNQLNIPIITSQLIVVWFKYDLQNMSNALIYGSIVEMLFERAAIKNQVCFPPIESAAVQFPESFSKLTYLHTYAATLEKVCLLSFLLLFEQDNLHPSLVFTKTQLMLKPYYITPEEVDFLCRLGILSKNKVIASFGEQEQKLSFLHMSYLEFLAALYVSLYDKTDLYNGTVKRMVCINDISKYKNFLILLSGIAPQMVMLFFDNIYTMRKDHLDQQRRNIKNRVVNDSFIDNRGTFYSIQMVALYCLREISVSDRSQRFIKVEDFIIDGFVSEHLKELLVMNKDNVKRLITRQYLDEFTVIAGLKYLHIYRTSGKYTAAHDVRFNHLMLQNLSTLQSVRIENCILTSELPVRSLPYLTSICLYALSVKHNVFHDLMHYISGNIMLEYICLARVCCSEHIWFDKECEMTLKLSDHSKLISFQLGHDHLVCSRINTSSLKSLTIRPHTIWPNLHKSSFIGTVNSMKNSKLEYLNLHGGIGLDSEELKLGVGVIKSLERLADLILEWLVIPDSVSLQLHPHLRCDRQINVTLIFVTMSATCFHDFINSIINSQSMFRVHIRSCKVLYNDQTSPNSLKNSTTMTYTVQYIESIPNLSITRKDATCIEFESKKRCI